MSHWTNSSVVELSAYELEQVRQIAAWKSIAPNRGFTRLLKKVTMPGARLLERMVPERWVRGCIQRSYQVALRMTVEDEELAEDGLGLKTRSLEECDTRAEERCSQANATAAMQGMLAGAGGMVTTFVDVPLLLALSMRTVMRIGQCYGYSLREQGDRKFVMGVLVAGTSGSLKMKRQRLKHLALANEWIFGQSQEEMLAEELFALLFHMELFEEIPGLGAVTGGLLNLGFMRQVSQTARRVFQERWLRDRGKLGQVETAEVLVVYRRSVIGSTLARAANSTFYCLGFGVALPASMVASTLVPIGGLLARGSRGADLSLDVSADEGLEGAGESVAISA